MILNTAAGFLTCTSRNEPITALCAALLWLPVSLELILGFYSLSLKPSVVRLTPTLMIYLLRMSLMAAWDPPALLVVPISRVVTKGDRAFIVWVPQAMELPVRISGRKTRCHLLNLLLKPTFMVLPFIELLHLLHSFIYLSVIFSCSIGTFTWKQDLFLQITKFFLSWNQTSICIKSLSEAIANQKNNS